jgi:Domain of unknown function (DUF5753)/Domain of unknown function (DUF397)
MARRSKQRSWWADYRDIMRTGSFIGLEAEAASVRAWAPNVMPGLLQTADYARALLTSGLPNPEPAQIDKRVQVRMTRQARLTGDDLLHFSAIIDEAVLRRTVGGAEAMRDQLRHLLEVSKFPNVNLQVLPLDAGEHALIAGPATLLEGGNDCVEVAELPHAVAIRDSKNADGPKLRLAPAQWHRFTDAIRRGDLDPS